MEKIINWSIIKKAIEDNWFSSNPTVSEEELDELAIGIAGEVDKFIRKRDKRFTPKEDKQ